MKMSSSLLIVVVCGFLAAACPAVADFEMVKASCSMACQVTVDECQNVARSYGANVTTSCVVMTAKIQGVTSHQCLVKIGLCTENEFVKLKNTACNESVETQTVESARVELYNTSTSKSCLTDTLNCIRLSSVSTVFKQQEQYCQLFKYENIKDCLSRSSCSANEVSAFNAASCRSSSTNAGGFAAAVIASSTSCRSGLDLCSGRLPAVVTLVQSEQYCAAMNFKMKGSAVDCLVKGNKLCTESEVDALKQAACSGTALHVAMVTFLACLIAGIFKYY